MSEQDPEPGFAPDNPTDGREPLDWSSKYIDPRCHRLIRFEAIYLLIFFIVAQLGLLLIWVEVPLSWFPQFSEKYQIFSKYAYGWLGGAFGGTLFSMKWLYHSVAKQIWHEDRWWWRMFTPLIAGGMGFVFVMLIQSALFAFFSPASLNSPSSCIIIGFLVGYFSDTALGKLSEIAQTFFGATRLPTKNRERRRNPASGSENPH